MSEDTIILVKQSPDRGADTKTFRAYRIGEEKLFPLGISASTTGNVVYGALRCAAKAFAHSDSEADIDEVEGRIKLTQLAAGQWQAELKD